MPNDEYSPYTLDETLAAIDLFKDHKLAHLSDSQIKMHLIRMMNGGAY